MTLPALQKNSVFFRKILSQFPQDFSLAFAYGSAVFRQNGSCQGQMRNNLYKKPCKYFDQGRGTCPFGGKCFYMHAYADGTRAEPDKPRKQLSAEGNVRFLNSVRLWDFIEEREHRGLPQYEDEVNELGELFMQLSGAEI